ncbi:MULTISPECIES: ABC transporter ATP-binding protein [Halobacterium]|uniref:ABC transporter ATP-binding protein n=1 Tax=Halobacterium TaxID=2239 RepID=UPI001F18CF27|nr:ABC transporter ATP-binding protein [Halobacterium salinarum]MCF2164368.1 ABC transporter ATP-binding protein [Halobacterium salinarum]MCF2167155.1 ABC transporter ATP-binding protein [Halobacterium salinarum]MCF2238620.1 ABC transporter ATP-binding protein [Halobacterium salinarum]WJK63854.1 ABC transporter ATP-binding protein [Halobacterium salinarum]
MQSTTPTADDDDPRDESILSIRNLQTVFRTDHEHIRAVDGISLSISPGETLGIVGESGSGKSVTARSIMGLVDAPGEVLPESSIVFDGTELTELSADQYQEVRGSGVGMIFQDPLKSLNPVYTVGNQIREALRINRGITGQEATDVAIDLLEDVAIPDPERRLDEYPNEFSGGMRQRAVIAMMLACDPDVLICDEPTTALDVTIQAQIVELLQDIQAERDLAILFITHDMGVIAEISDRVNVMYAGEFVEKAPVEELFANPKHPYTQGLLDAIPGTSVDDERLNTIEGDVPTPNQPATDCRFAPRCPKAFEDCTEVHPTHVSVSDSHDHSTACLLYPEGKSRTERVEHHRSQAPADTQGGAQE